MSHSASCDDNSRVWFLRRKNPDPSWVIVRSIFVTKRETRHVRKNWRAKEYITHDKIMRTYLQFCHQFLNLFKKETVLSTNFFNLCPCLLTEPCLAKSCFISLTHLSKRIWAYMDKLILECLCRCVLNRRIRNCQLYRNFYPSFDECFPKNHPTRCLLHWHYAWCWGWFIYSNCMLRRLIKLSLLME